MRQRRRRRQPILLPAAQPDHHAATPFLPIRVSATAAAAARSNQLYLLRCLERKRAQGGQIAAR
jgi:hypothetical protein